jgi:hypothetical protein
MKMRELLYFVGLLLAASTYNERITGLSCLVDSSTSRSAFQRYLLSEFDYILYWEFVLQAEDLISFWFLFILCEFHSYFPLRPSWTAIQIWYDVEYICHKSCICNLNCLSIWCRPKCNNWKKHIQIYYYGDKTVEDEMGGICSTHREHWKMHPKFELRKTWREGKFGNRSLGNRIWGCVLDTFGLV